MKNGRMYKAWLYNIKPKRKSSMTTARAKGIFASELRKNATICERMLWKELAIRGLVRTWQLQQQFVVGKFIGDMASRKHRVIIEVDGGSHFGREEYDKNRDHYLNMRGYAVIRIKNADIMADLKGATDKLCVKVKNCINCIPEK